MAWKSGVAKAGKTCGNEVRSCCSAPLSSVWVIFLEEALFYSKNHFLSIHILSTFINECVLGVIKH